jgi:hypothetical protein
LFTSDRQHQAVAAHRVFGRLSDAAPRQPRDHEPTLTGTARIRGRILAADTLEPLRRADVRLNAPELHEMRSTITDINGEYEFSNLQPGRYTVNAFTNGFIGLTYGRLRAPDVRRSWCLNSPMVCCCGISNSPTTLPRSRKQRTMPGASLVGSRRIAFHGLDY